MNKRRHSKASDWLPMVEAWKKSGLTKKHFCQQNNISYKTFYRWTRKWQESDSTTAPLAKSIETAMTDFIPITMKEISKQTPTLEQRYMLSFNNKLTLQIPAAMMNTAFLQMVMTATGVRSC